MSVAYTAICWSSHKRVYDFIVVAIAFSYIISFFIISKLAFANAHSFSDEVIVLRALGSCAIILLHIILCIGPLARLSPRLLPVLYNRRHLGVITFFIALAHGVLATIYYHGFSEVFPLVSLLSTNTQFTSFINFPYQLLGVAALVILFLLAATSHDFWLKNLSPRIWKSLHMLVYLAYTLLIGHVALGALQVERSPIPAVLIGLGCLTVISLHIASGFRERSRDLNGAPISDWVDAGPADTIPLDRARTLCLSGGERIAIFRTANSISAVENVCAHQGGPLGEGKIIDGCITCPWHGWQYRPQDGCSPPPFAEKIKTFQVRISAGRVQVNPRPLAPGTPTTPAVFNPASEASHA